MNVLVTCFSLSGNTKKIADSILEELESLSIDAQHKELSKISPATFNEYDLVFLGSACHDADLAEPVIHILQDMADKPTFKLAGFVTHAASMPKEDTRIIEYYEQWAGRCPETFERISKEKEIEFLGYFHCQGNTSPPIAEFIHREIIPDEEEWNNFYTEMIHHPNDVDLEDARQFTREILQMMSVKLKMQPLPR